MEPYHLGNSEIEYLNVDQFPTIELRELASRLNNRFSQINREKAHASADLLELQDNCPHPIDMVVKGDIVSHEGGHSTPSFRVCKLCGLGEEGWGTYDRIHRELSDCSNQFPILSREEAMKFVRTFMTRDDQTRRQISKATTSQLLV